MRYRHSRLPFWVAVVFIAVYFLMIPLLLHFTMSKDDHDADDIVDNDGVVEYDTEAQNDRNMTTSGEMQGGQRLKVNQENATEENSSETDIDIATNKDKNMNSELQTEKDNMIDVIRNITDQLKEVTKETRVEKDDEALVDKDIDRQLDDVVSEKDSVLSVTTDANIHVDQITMNVDLNFDIGMHILADVNLYNTWDGQDESKSYKTSADVYNTETAMDISYFSKTGSADSVSFKKDNRHDLDTSVWIASKENISVFDINFESNEDIFKDWVKNSQVHCDGSLIFYANLFIHTSDIIMDPNKVTGARGGESITEVLWQSESVEFLKPSPGIFRLLCDKIPSTHFKPYSDGNKGHIPLYLSATRTQENMSDTMSDVDVEEMMTIMLVRYEYANLFHSINDLFNAFLLCVFFHENPTDVNILIMDGHPWGKIDPVWEKLFGNVTRVKHLTKPVNYHSLVWSMFEKHSPLNDHSLKDIPLLRDFRTFVLESYGVEGKPSAECSKSMNITVVLRRDYLAHPRNPSGRVQRKIKNDVEIVEGIQRTYPNYIVVGCDFSNMDFKQQLELVANSDIIVGMHGAGLTHMVFMPNSGGLIELAQYGPTRNDKQSKLFSKIAQWKNFSYSIWKNTDKTLDLSDDYTFIPPEILLGLLDKQVKRICQ